MPPHGDSRARRRHRCLRARGSGGSRRASRVPGTAWPYLFIVALGTCTRARGLFSVARSSARSAFAMLGERPDAAFWAAAALMGSAFGAPHESHEHEHAHEEVEQQTRACARCTHHTCRLRLGCREPHAHRTRTPAGPRAPATPTCTTGTALARDAHHRHHPGRLGSTRGNGNIHPGVVGDERDLGAAVGVESTVSRHSQRSGLASRDSTRNRAAVDGWCHEVSFPDPPYERPRTSVSSGGAVAIIVNGCRSRSSTGPCARAGRHCAHHAAAKTMRCCAAAERSGSGSVWAPRAARGTNTRESRRVGTERQAPVGRRA